jgi:arginyl-tRNA synthetase
VGETGPYIQNAVVRARNILAKLEAEEHRVADLVARGETLDLGRLLEGEEGDEVWSLLLLMSRSDEVAEQSIRAEDVALLAKHVFSVAQAFHSYYQQPKYSVLYAETDDQRAFRTLLVIAFVRQMEGLLGLLGIPVPERM